MVAITQFKDDYGFLSNFYPCYIRFEGRVYPSLEHAYQAAKTFDEDIRTEISQLKGKPGKAKKIGNKIKLREDWDVIKVDIMRRLVMEKFTNDPEMEKKLLETENRELVEGNTWHDNYWGRCYCSKCQLKLSRNMLGHILMETRELLQKEK